MSLSIIEGALGEDLSRASHEREKPHTYHNTVSARSKLWGRLLDIYYNSTTGSLILLM